MTTTLYAIEAVDAFTASYDILAGSSNSLFSASDGLQPAYSHEIGSNPISYNAVLGRFNFDYDGIYTFALSGDAEYYQEVDINISLNSL